MPANQDDDVDVLPIDLDRQTRLRLKRLSAATGKHPRELATSLLREMLEDDDRENRLDPPRMN